MAGAVRLGLIGVGRWGRVYLRTIAALGERCRVTHLAASTPPSASLVPYPVRVERDWHRLVASDCDALIIATPAATHAEIVEACVDAGKPCIVEKPFCLDVATAERLHARIQATGALVLVGHTQLFDPAYQALKRRLQHTREPIRAILAERVGPAVPRSDTSETPVVWEWGPHDVSLCLDLLERLPQRVDALAGPQAPAESPALVLLRLEFSGGACAWIQIGWLAAKKRRAISFVTDRRLYLFDDVADQKLTACSLDGKEQEALAVTDAQPAMAAMLSYFLDGFAGGDRRYFGSALALQVTGVLAECEQALRVYNRSAVAR